MLLQKMKLIILAICLAVLLITLGHTDAARRRINPCRKIGGECIDNDAVGPRGRPS